VLHQETSSPGRVGQLLQAMGFPLDIAGRRSATGCPTRWKTIPARWCSAGR
jgi:hypothetical protein